MIAFQNLLRPEVQEFIKVHENDDIPELILKGSPFDDVTIQMIAQQVKGRQVAKKKIPLLYENYNIVYPPKLNLEQSSSQQTAEYKSNLITKTSKIIDLTGGFGIDVLSFCSKTDDVSYCEINSKTYHYAVHNFKALHKKIKTHQADGIKVLKDSKDKFDWIYLDPARRNAYNQKVFRLADCTPNVLEHISLLRSKSKHMMVKISPLFDINLSLKQLPYITEIHIVAFKNEVKELVLIFNFKEKTVKPRIFAVNLGTDQAVFVNRYEDLNSNQNLSLPSNYLYEPNAAIMKSGFFGALCKTYNVSALGTNSHLFTSDQLINFPGRSFKISKVVSPQKKEINKYLPSRQANISTRNYPLKPKQIKDKYNLKDGGSDFVFFTENYKKEKIVLICEKIKKP